MSKKIIIIFFLFLATTIFSMQISRLNVKLPSSDKWDCVDFSKNSVPFSTIAKCSYKKDVGLTLSFTEINADAKKYNYQAFTIKGTKSFGLNFKVDWSNSRSLKEDINGLRGWRLSGGKFIYNRRDTEQSISIVNSGVVYPVLFYTTIPTGTSMADRNELGKLLKTIKKIK